MPASDILLDNGTLLVGIAPQLGGSLTRFAIRRSGLVVDILRPSKRNGFTWRGVLGGSCFPLVPYCGRLRRGRFTFHGRQYEYPLNAPSERHSSHGDGWMLPWQLRESGASFARMRLTRASSSGISYTCDQAIRIAADALRITLAVRNDGAAPAPFGIGLHPYFANRDLAVVSARLPRYWRWDQELMPIRDAPNALQSRMERRLPAGELPVAAEFTGWTGSARIEWPSLGVSVILDTAPRMQHVVIWAPANERFFCFEPTSHATDSHHGYAPHAPMEDLIVLNPGEDTTQTFEFRVHLQP